MHGAGVFLACADTLLTAAGAVWSCGQGPVRRGRDVAVPPPATVTDGGHAARRRYPLRLLLSCVMVLALAFPAMAAQGGFQGPGQAPGGFQGPTSGVQADTVAKALKAWDDAPVMLTGHIVERVAGSDDKYNFRDATGTIVVEIDHEVFAGRTVTPADRVRLSGKLDKEMMDPTKVDVKVLEILK